MEWDTTVARVLKPLTRYFAGLGALPNFSDNLLIFAYERQRTCDPDSAPFYLGCLREVAQARQSETLHTKVALMASSGEISYREVHEAYRFFGVDSLQDDASVIGAFQARMADAPRQEVEARQHLQAIGVARRSEAIQSTASSSRSISRGL